MEITVISLKWLSIHKYMHTRTHAYSPAKFK